jgi:hypothetical protein
MIMPDSISLNIAKLSSGAAHHDGTCIQRPIQIQTIPVGYFAFDEPAPKIIKTLINMTPYSL